MKYEKQRVSMLNTVIARMKNNVYDSQEDLMRAVLKVLCCTKNADFKYAYSKTTFEEDNALLVQMKLERSINGNIIKKQAQEG